MSVKDHSLIDEYVIIRLMLKWVLTLALVMGLFWTLAFPSHASDTVTVDNILESMVSDHPNVTLAEIRRAYVRLYVLEKSEQAFQESLPKIQADFQTLPKNLSHPRISLLILKLENDLMTVQSERAQAGIYWHALMDAPEPAALHTAKWDHTIIPYALDTLTEKALFSRLELKENERDMAKVQKALGSSLNQNLLNVEPDKLFATTDLEMVYFKRERAKQLVAKAQYKQLELEKASLKSKIALEVADAQTAYQFTGKQLQRYETEMLPLMQKWVEKAESKRSPLERIQMETKVLKLKLDYWDCFLKHQYVISELEEAVGEPLQGQR